MLMSPAGRSREQIGCIKQRDDQADALQASAQLFTAPPQ
jgi:hypothetical protein